MNEKILSNPTLKRLYESARRLALLKVQIANLQALGKVLAELREQTRKLKPPEKASEAQ
jgi:hypothetical protein